MFIINLTYKVALEQVDAFLEEHVLFLNQQYKLGHFIASGRKNPRTGGIILAKVASKAALETLLEKDPFKANALADYEIVEFIPTKTCEALNFLLE